jgi:trk system potassium uptake protein TrkA
MRKINFPEGAIIGAVVRGDEVIIPDGDTIIKPDDKVIIFALQKSVAEVEKSLMVKLEYF